MAESGVITGTESAASDATSATDLYDTDPAQNRWRNSRVFSPVPARHMSPPREDALTHHSRAELSQEQ